MLAKQKLHLCTAAVARVNGNRLIFWVRVNRMIVNGQRTSET